MAPTTRIEAQAKDIKNGIAQAVKKTTGNAADPAEINAQYTAEIEAPLKKLLETVATKGVSSKEAQTVEIAQLHLLWNVMWQMNVTHPIAERLEETITIDAILEMFTGEDGYFVKFAKAFTSLFQVNPEVRESLENIIVSGLKTTCNFLKAHYEEKGDDEAILSEFYDKISNMAFNGAQKYLVKFMQEEVKPLIAESVDGFMPEALKQIIPPKELSLMESYLANFIIGKVKDLTTQDFPKLKAFLKAKGVELGGAVEEDAEQIQELLGSEFKSLCAAMKADGVDMLSAIQKGVAGLKAYTVEGASSIARGAEDIGEKLEFWKHHAAPAKADVVHASAAADSVGNQHIIIKKALDGSSTTLIPKPDMNSKLTVQTADGETHQVSHTSLVGTSADHVVVDVSSHDVPA